MEMVTLFAIVTLLLASFDISLCQRKVSRNVALGSEVKTVANFNCPEEFGYYPHPNDCTQYYVCVFGGALLESCTGGLMYSHELQTCDWPRNVGCDGAEISGPVAATSASPPSRTREEPRTRYTPPTPPPAQPAAIVTSRGQPRQLQHNQQEIIKQRQQQQLYADAEETLPPAEEVESDRQQRVYRGQPSTVGQVQKDRDGLRHSNAIPTYNGRSERIGVISFGTQQQQQQPQQQQYSTIDDKLSNDLTLKRRRKRQTQRSRIRSIETSWRGGQQNFQTSRLNIGPYTLQPPPLQNPVFSSSYQKNNFVPSPLIDNEFKPFVPNYHKVPTHTVAKKVPFTSTSNDYFTAITTFRPIKPILREPNKLRHTIDYYRHKNLMLPQHTHIINHNTSSIQITNPNINLSTASTTSTPMYSDNSKEEENNKATAEYPDFPEQFFGPPASYFNTKNKYESIENPFANPHFDFDKFLSGLREEPSTTVPNPVEKVESKPKSTIPPKTDQPNEYYYYEYEEDDVGRYETNEAPKKIYSSQIKPTLKTLPKPINDYYYEEEYDYPQKNNNKPVNVSKNGEMKYSAKYQGKPLKVIKTTRVPQTATTSVRPTTKKLLTSETFASSSTVSSTTQKPKYTTRRKSKLTIPTTRPSRSKQRQRLTDDDKKVRVDTSSAAPVQPAISTATATARALYNSSQYNNNNYDPYYALYDDDVELYRDDDYSQQYNNNNNNAAQSQTPHYRRTPSPVIQSTQEEAPKRGTSGYIQNNYNYQPNSNSDYNDDNNYNSQVEDQNAYRQVNRQPTRGDRNDLNYLEEASTKRTTTTTSRKTTTRTTTLRTFPSKKSTVPSRLPVTAHENKTQAQSIINTLRDDPGPHPLTPHTIDPKHNSSLGLDETTTFRPHLPDTQSKLLSEAVVYKPAPFALTEHLTTEKPIIFHYITKSPRSTTLVSTELSSKTSTVNNSDLKNKTIIVPTTYSPPKFFLKSLLPKSLTDSTTIPNLSDTKPHKTLKSVRKLISPINVNYGLSTVTSSNFESAEKLVSDVDNIKNSLHDRHSQTSEEKLSDEYIDEPTTKETKLPTSSESLPVSSESISVVYNPSKADDYYIDDEIINSHEESKLRHYVEPYNHFNVSSESKRFRTTIEIPPPHDLIDDSFKPKQEPDQSPDYKIQPYPKPVAQTTKTTTTTSTVKTTTTDSSPSTSIPARVSRVNTAIKSLIAVGGTQRQNVKCHENQNAYSKCHDPKHQRTSTRGRGSTHYANGGNIVNNEVTVTVNRGTPASRPRPTLKPSTSIVSKASEFIDIYRYPPSRPAPIYPQPQPDKTAAKCRKDVCLLPDCSCGGKEIPGNLPVEEVPQIVLLTFDDAVNDLNKQYYIELFESGRRNPNGCPIAATFYVSHEWTDYSQVQNLYADGHEMASHTVSHSFGEQFSQKKWTREVAGQREILSAYGGVHLEDVRGMRAPFLSVGGNKMFKMLYDSNFTYDSSMPIYENKPPSWPYTLDYKLFHDCMIPPCPTRSYPGVWEVPMVMWQDLNGGRCSMGDACSNPPDAEGVFKMLTKNFQRHYTTNRAPFGLFYHAAWFTQPHHKEGFINFLDSILEMKDVWLVTNWQAIQWVRDPTPISRLNSFQPFQCDFSNRPKRCNNPKVCNLWHKSGVRYMRTCQPCPDIYPWTGNTGIRSSRIDNDIED
ncbi:uncharacterized protein LOC123006716 isoform X2 [Tribolium madens]|uniref:uncharacterized protein LOC123006716 isoform X2 n=1 Tax=Tribolium madens TaxID=41895 RepID=UPI001CF736FF|nr:uncharacterized protein LOC123006716 isoform X2 [Tribolium madens]